MNKFLQRGSSEIYKEAIATFERLMVKRALELTNNNQAMAAKLLGISRNTLREKLEKVQNDNLSEK